MSISRKLLKLTFNSDWHVGSGAGIPGNVDSQVLRDGDGFPYVPGKTLTGMLRDAAEWIADTRGGKWPAVVISLFGNQPETHGGMEHTAAISAKIGIGSAELDKNIRDYIIKFSRKDTDIDMTAALFSVQPGVKIDVETGRSLDDHLFSTEKSRRDCVLYAPVVFMSELDDNENKLLNDAVKAVRRIGGKRRRGAGECSLALYNECDYKNLHEKNFNFNFDFKNSVTLDIRLKTLQPVVITRTTLGNEVRSDTEIPGAMLLSYYINNVLAPLGKERITRAVMNGEITVSSFLPEFDGKASMPVPLCLGELKEEKIPLNRLVTLPQDSKKQIKDLRTGYVTVSGENMIYHSGASQRIVRTHNTVDDASQRPTEDVGGLFTYEAVRAGETFRGTLHIKANLWNEIKQYNEILSSLTYDQPALGRSRKDEYGDVELECAAASADDDLDLISTELIGGRNINAKGKYCVIYLLSDLLLRNKYQGYTVRLDDVRDALSQKLGVKLDDIPADEWEEDKTGDYSISPLGGTRGHCVRAVRRESWQRSWTLPRPSLVALKAGSVFMFKVSDPENWDNNKALTLMQDGLGERRTEGYGRIIINPPFLCGKNSEVIKSEDNNNLVYDNELKLPENTEAKNFILKLAADAVKKNFRQTARREAYEIIKKDNGTPFASYPNVRWSDRPSASQFGALREAAAAIDGNKNENKNKNEMKIFKQWADAVSDKDRKAENNPWKEPWQKMLRDMAEHPEMIWELRPAFKLLFKHLKDNKLESEFIRSSDMLSLFIDLLCEAVFDEEKRKSQ